MERTFLPEFFHLSLCPHLPLLFSLSLDPPQLPVTPHLAAGQSQRKDSLAVGLLLKEERGSAAITSTVYTAGLMTAQMENPGGSDPLLLLTFPFLLTPCRTNSPFQGPASWPWPALPCLRRAAEPCADSQCRLGQEGHVPPRCRASPVLPGGRGFLTVVPSLSPQS